MSASSIAITRARIKRARIAELRRLVAGGMSVSQIAELIGATRTAVVRELRQLGFLTQRPHGRGRENS